MSTVPIIQPDAIFKTYRDYWLSTPLYLIRDVEGNIYNFPTGYFIPSITVGNTISSSIKIESPGVGGQVTESSDILNGIKYSSYPQYDGSGSVLWTRAWQVTNTDYSKIVGSTQPANKYNYFEVNSTTPVPSGSYSRVPNYQGTSIAKLATIKKPETINTLNQLGDLPGYVKVSSGTSFTDSRNYILAPIFLTGRPGSAAPILPITTVAFALYIKKDINSFFKDMVTNNPKIFANLAAVDAQNGNQRYNLWHNGYINRDTPNVLYFGIEACDNNAASLDKSGQGQCSWGTAQWCAGNFNNGALMYDTIPTTGSLNGTNTLNKPISPNNVCYKTVTVSDYLDNNLIKLCRDSTNIITPFCQDLRQNTGGTNVKNALNQRLSDYCANDNNINTKDVNGKLICQDVINACKTTNAIVDDTTVPNFKCNTLFKSLNANNRINTQLGNIDLNSSIAGVKTMTTDQKLNMLSGFNTSGSIQIESMLCTLSSSNADDPACKKFIQDNFTALIKTDDTNPVFVMYFGNNGSNPITSASIGPSNGMDYTNSLCWDNSTTSNKFPFRNATTSASTGLISSSLSMPWFSKLYAYILPSTTDQYLFQIQTKGNARLFINNSLIIDTWASPLGTSTVSATAGAYLNFIQGQVYLLYVEYCTPTQSTSANINSMLNIQYTSKTNTSVKLLNTTLKIAIPSFNSTTTILTPTILNAYGVTNPSTLVLSVFNPYNLADVSKQIQSIAYCSANNNFVTDVNCLGTINNGYSGINKQYATTNEIQKNTANSQFLKTINNYCSDPAYNRFATDAQFCTNPNYISYTLKTPASDPDMKSAMQTYCTNPINNQYAPNTTTSYCRTTDKNNMVTSTMHDDYATAIRDGRLTYTTNQMNNATLSSNTTPGVITQDIIDYINNDYPTIQTKYGINTYPDSKLFKPEILNYCENVPDATINPLCNTIYNSNYNNYQTPNNVTNSQLNYMKKQISNAVSPTSTNPGFIKPHVAKYITTDYPLLQNKNNIYKYPNSNILSPDVFSYCENVPDITKDPLCNTLYTVDPNKLSIYDNDPNLLASKIRINDFKYGVSTNAFLGLSTDATANQVYQQQAQDPILYPKYLPYAINYCGTGNNIVTPACQTYYNNASYVINQGINSAYNQATSLSATQAQLSPQTMASLINTTPTVAAPETTPVATTTPETAPVTATPAPVVETPVKSAFGNCDDMYYEDNSRNNTYTTFLLFICLIILAMVLVKYMSKCTKSINVLSENIFSTKSNLQNIIK